MTSRTTSWSSTTRMVPLTLPVSPSRIVRRIPVPGRGYLRRAGHTGFLLVSRLHRRPVRRDARVAELAVRRAHGRLPQELPVGLQELVDAAVHRHGSTPRDAQPLPQPDQRARLQRGAGADDEVAAGESLNARVAHVAERLPRRLDLTGRGGVEEPQAGSRCTAPGHERERALARVVVDVVE